MVYNKFEKIIEKHREIEGKLSTAVSDLQEYAKLAKEYRRLEKIVEAYNILQRLEKQIEGNKEIIDDEEDAELSELAKDELPELETRRDKLESELKIMLLPPDPRDNRNIIVEIRAGTGGQEACLFAGDLFRMYRRFAERNRWKLEVLSSNPSDLGGFKEIIFSIVGERVYSLMCFESGVHRVQRVPITEASGRIHTSAATIAVLPEADEVEIEISADDLKVDVFRSSGPGGQSVNTTDSAVRVTHIPTGLVVTCQDEKSQHKNKAQALKVLRARLYDIALKEQEAKESQIRRQMVSTGDRSAKIRTYNFPQGRVTDHRIKLTLYRLEEIMDGNIWDLIERLRLADSEERLTRLEMEA